MATTQTSKQESSDEQFQKATNEQIQTMVKALKEKGADDKTIAECINTFNLAIQNTIKNKENEHN